MDTFFVVVSVNESVEELTGSHFIQSVLCELSFHELLDHNSTILWLSSLIWISDLIHLLFDGTLSTLTFQLRIVLQKLS